MSIVNAKKLSLFLKHPSLSTRLVLLVICAVALAFLLAWHFSQEAILSLENTKRTAALQSAYQAAIHEGDLFSDIRQSLLTLAAVPGLVDNSKVCRETLRNVIQANPVYLSLEIADKDGQLVCSSSGSAVVSNFSDAEIFAEVSAAQKFLLSSTESGAKNGNFSLLAANPITDNNGGFAGAIFAVIDPGWINQIISDYQLPEKSHLMILDDDGKILYSFPEQSYQTGSVLDTLFRRPATRGAMQKTELTLTGSDQTQRVYDLVPLDHDGNFSLAIGLPAYDAFSPILAARILNFAGQALIALFSVLCAWSGIRLLIGKRINTIIAANERLAAGDGSARTGLDYNTDEIGHLARSFDNMAETLQYNKFSLESESAARIASEQRYRRLFRDAVFGIFQATPQGKLIDVNPAYARLFGYDTPEDVVSAITDVSMLYVHPEKRGEIVDTMIKTRMPINVDNEYRRKDGTHFIGNLHSWAVFNRDDRLEMLEGSIEDVSAQKESRDVITRQVEQLSSLRTIDLAIGTNLDLKVTLNIILEQATTHLHVDAACIYLYNPIMRTLNHILGRGFVLGDYQVKHAPFSSTKSEMELLEEMSLRVPDVSAAGPDFNPPERFWEEKFVAYISLPLIAKGQIKGVLEIFNRVPLELNREWVDYLNNLAAQTAVAIDSSELFTNLKRSNHELRQAYDATIEGWSRALDLRDHETNDHTMRTADITVRLAQAFGISDADLIQIRWGALLHDIGKMAIPDSILNKPGPLNEDEWVEMKRHPIYARDMLATIDFLQPALEIPYCHHEKWNGEGYPRQLKGPIIPLPARIFSVVDVWDALRSDRPYRKAWPEDKIRTYIKEQTGSHFDPSVVEAFTNWLDESGDYRN
jgi:PAS domain S-box-containing protein/putative nucleotidyltransferase with HDIG domain